MKKMIVVSIKLNCLVNELADKDINDIVEKIINDELRNRDSIWPLIGDLFDGGVVFNSSNKKEVELLQELGFFANHTDDSFEKGMSIDELRVWSNNSTWVIDKEEFFDSNLSLSSNGGTIFVCDHKPKVIKPMRIINIMSQNGDVFVYVNGDEDPSYVFNKSEDNWNVKLSRVIKKLAHKRKKKPAPMIVIPPAKNGMTNLQKEISFFNSLIENRLSAYIPPDKSDEEAVLGVILSHTRTYIKLTSDEINDLKLKVSLFMSERKPIEITISLAIGCRIQNRLKFFDDTNLPTFGWMHMAWYFRFINEKVKKIYKPGIKIIVFDEATLFNDLIHISSESVSNSLLATRKIIDMMNAPIEIYEMKKDFFPEEIVVKKCCACDPQVYAMACSLPEVLDDSFMRHLYNDRERDYEKIKQEVGKELWNKAQCLSDTVVSFLSWRKEVKLFEQLGFKNAIDACVTDKDGRIVFDITSGLLINHGMPLLKRGEQGLYKCMIIPEYRIAIENSQATSILIDPVKDFGIDEKPYNFYYT